MARYRLALLARSDLGESFQYNAERSGVRNASRLHRQIRERFPRHAEQPLIGRARPELGSDLRSFPVGNYIIIYRPISDGVEIVRVLHGSRDIESLFEI